MLKIFYDFLMKVLLFFVCDDKFMGDLGNDFLKVRGATKVILSFRQKFLFLH